jgi:hypothetical protein
MALVLAIAKCDRVEACEIMVQVLDERKRPV